MLLPSSRKCLMAAPQVISEVGTFETLSGHCKSGQRWSGQNRPTEVAGDSVVLPCLRLWRQVSFRTPAPRTAFEYMPMMQKAVEHGGDGSAVSQQLAPVLYRPVGSEQGTGALIAPHHDFQQLFGGSNGELSHAEIVDDKQWD